LRPSHNTNHPDPEDPAKVFVNFYLEHNEHLLGMSEDQFDKGYSLALRCYSGRINDKYNSVTQDRGDV
jgi:hypothetical protein